MMIKYKVSDVAKDFGVQSKDIINILSAHISEPKKTGSVLNEAELDIIFDVMTQNNQVESFDAYFKSGEGAKKQGQAQTEKERKLMEQLAILEQLKAAAQAEEDAKNNTASAISFGVPMRCSGVASTNSLMVASSSLPFISVSISPGAMQFTVMLDGPTSSANAFVSPITAAFDAE